MDNVGWQMIEGCWEPIEHEDRVPEGGACTSCGAEYVPGEVS